MSDEQISRLLLALAFGLLVVGFLYGVFAHDPTGFVLAAIGSSLLVAYMAHQLMRFGWARAMGREPAPVVSTEGEETP